MGTAAGEQDTVLENVGSQLGRCMLQHTLNGLGEHAQRLVNGFGDIIAVDAHGLGQTGDQVAAGHIHVGLLGAGDSRAQIDLQLLSGALADVQAVLAPQMTDDGIAEGIAAHFDTVLHQHPVGGDDADIGHTCADIHDQGTVGAVDGQACAKRGSQRTMDQLGAAHTHVEHGGNEGTALGFVHAAGHGHHSAGARKEVLAHHLTDKGFEHGAHQIKVHDRASAQRADGQNIAGGAADHFFSFVADGDNVPGVPVHRNHSWLVELNTASLHINEDARSSQIDRDIADTCHEFR